MEVHYRKSGPAERWKLVITGFSIMQFDCDKNSLLLEKEVEQMHTYEDHEVE